MVTCLIPDSAPKFTPLPVPPFRQISANKRTVTAQLGFPPASGKDPGQPQNTPGSDSVEPGALLLPTAHQFTLAGPGMAYSDTGKYFF